MDLKLIVDILASVASIVAIASVMLGWHRSARKPLIISRVVVHRKSAESTFILVVKNRQPYPVVIHQINCYKKKIFVVEKRKGGRPEYSGKLSSQEALFISNSDFLVPPSAHTDFRIKVSGAPDIPNSIVFSVETSHGYHDLSCKNITLVDVGSHEAYAMEYSNQYESEARAKFVFYWQVAKELTSRLSR